MINPQPLTGLRVTKDARPGSGMTSGRIDDEIENKQQNINNLLTKTQKRMKKILLFASALAGLFLAGSCQKETLEPAAQGGVTYEITLPDGPQTKGELGYQTYDLHYEVYKTATDDAAELAKAPLLFEKTVEMTGNKTTLTLDLLNDQDYTVLFWANKAGANENNLYFDLTDLRNVVVKTATANNDNRDAFCGMDQLVQHDGAQSKTVELKRPFAQVNIATLVPTKAQIGYDVTPTDSYVKVSSIPMAFNVFTGLPGANTTAVEFSTPDNPADIPGGMLKGTDYNWVAMNYILVPESVVEVYYEITTVNGIVKNTIPNVPVKKNYRTNIIGNLLTSNATYTIEVVPGFEGNFTGNSDMGYDISDLLSVEGAIVELPAGARYRLPATIADNVTIIGGEGTVLTCPVVVNAKNITVRNVEFEQVINEKKCAALRLNGYGTFEDCTFIGMNGLYQGYSDEGALTGLCTFTRCRFDASWAYAFNTAGSGPVVIDDCEIIGWTSFGHKGATTIKDTDFDWNGTYGKLRMYDATTVTGCTFTENMSIDFYNPYQGSIAGKALTFTDNSFNGGSIVGLINMGCFSEASPVLTIDGVTYGPATGNEIELEAGKVAVLTGASEGVEVKGNGTLILDNVTIGGAITKAAATGNALTIAAGSEVVLQIRGTVSLQGAEGAIIAEEGAKLTISGDTLLAEGLAGSGIGGSVTIENLAHLTAKGNGNHAFGIGGNDATVMIKNSTVDYACGGHIQPLCINDPKYGKSEPEGGAAIGGAVVKIEGSTVTKADGGSKAAAIGAQYWQSTAIEIVNSTIVEANGGNASAGIGGSRYAGDAKHNVSVKILNSNVTATGGQFGAGIGAGYDTHCNGEKYSATNYIEIDATSVINAKGGKYAPGIGTGYHSAYLTGSIAAGAEVTAVAGDETFYKDSYTTAQNIGYGVVDPAREFSGNNANVTFTVAGKVIEYPIPYIINEDDKTISIYTAAGLVAVSNLSIEGGFTVLLGSDIDLTGIEFNGLYAFHPESNNTFDGQGHTVSNWTYTGGAADMGFIKQWVGTIKNVTIEGASLKTAGRSAVLAGKVYANIENCHIVDSRIEDSYWACGVIAGLYNSGSITNCSVNGCYVKSNGGVGGIVGVINEAAGERKIEMCTVKYTTVNNTGAYGETYSGALVAGMFNAAGATYEFAECTLENNTKEGQYVGDLFYSAEGETVYVDGVQQ